MNKTMPHPYKKFVTLALCITIGVTVSSCGNRRETRGYLFDNDLANAIAPGVDNRQSVYSTLGSPTIPATFNDDKWYYVSTQVRVRPIFWPEAQTHRVMAVTFNERGVVDDVTNFDLSDTENINPVNDKTPTRGRKLSFFQQVFGTIGQFGGARQNGNNPDNPTGPNG